MRPAALACLALVLGLLAALAPPARAGSYTVYACESAGRVWDNRSWAGTAAPGISADTACPTAGTPIGNGVGPGTRVPENAAGTTTFTAPAGTTIADFSLTRGFVYVNPTQTGTHRLYALYRLGGQVFAGAGNYDDAVRNRLNAQRSWYGYPENDVTLPKATVGRASFPALAGYRGDATTLQVSVGCFKRGSPCSVAAGGRVRSSLYGMSVILNDPAPPTATVEASGLLAGGQRSGSDPVTVTASDNAGIRGVEILDVTGGGMTVVGAEHYDQGDLTQAGAGCSFRLAKPCPDLGAERVTPTGLPAGRRTLTLRVTDAGGNIADRGPYPVDVATPSDRGALNGYGATEDASLSARFRRGPATRQTVAYQQALRVTGRLLNSAGNPISGAQLRILSRDLRQGARPVERGSVTTGTDGAYSATVHADASRLIQVAWRSHVNDPRYQKSAYVTLKARASARLSASPTRVALGRSVVLSGRVRGTLPPRGVALIFQGRAAGGRYSTFADAQASRSGAFRVSYRFRSGSSRGRTFVFRVKLRRDAGFPYELGYSSRVRVHVG